MADERYSFAQARTRLEEIVAQVRKKDVSLETSLDLLEEGVRLANVCTELSDHAEWRTVAEEQAAQADPTAVAEAVDVPAEQAAMPDEGTDESAAGDDTAAEDE
jgi:exodeoxyribonuclease VII small subunit